MKLYNTSTQVIFIYDKLTLIEDNELRFKSILTDIKMTEKNANNPKKYTIKLNSITE